MQLSFDAADRLVELVQARRGPVPADEAARTLFALASAPTAIARSLLDDVVRGDARLAWRGPSVGLAHAPGSELPLERAAFAVFGTSVTPCHRALADARATAEILVALLGLAQERGVATVAELVEISAPRARRLHGRRSLRRPPPELTVAPLETGAILEAVNGVALAA